MRLYMYKELYFCKELLCCKLISLDVYFRKIVYLTGVKEYLSLVDSVLTAVNSEFMGVSM